MIYSKSIFCYNDFSFTTDSQQKSAILKKLSLRKISTNLKYLPKFFFLRRSPSNKFSLIFYSTLKFLRYPTTEPGLIIIISNLMNQSAKITLVLISVILQAFLVAALASLVDGQPELMLPQSLDKLYAFLLTCRLFLLAQYT